jgi:hypothetical protein
MDSRQLSTRRLNPLSLSKGDDGSEIDEAAGHWDVGNVHGPDLIGVCHRELAEEVGIDPVARRRL